MKSDHIAADNAKDARLSAPLIFLAVVGIGIGAELARIVNEVASAATAIVNVSRFKAEISLRKKKQALKFLLEVDNLKAAIVFANRKTTVRELSKDVQKSGFKSGEIHGDMDHASRIAGLELLKKGKVNFLVASEFVARRAE